MKRTVALFVTLSFLIVFAGNYYFFLDKQTNREAIVIERAIDGDTIITRDGRTIRLLNINTPERNEPGYEEAKEFLQTFENKSAFFDNRGVEKYGRSLGVVYVDNQNINRALVEKGLAHTLLVDDKDVKEFHRAQEEAFQRKIGIWKRSPSYGCMRAEIDKKAEYVSFRSDCASNLRDWTIKDETTHSYTLTGPVEREFALYSGEGVETSRELYWDRGNAWNNDRDSLFVRDENGFLVLYSSYGY